MFYGGGGVGHVIFSLHLGVGHSVLFQLEGVGHVFCSSWKGWVMCFLTTTFRNAPAHPPPPPPCTF